MIYHALFAQSVLYTCDRMVTYQSLCLFARLILAQNGHYIGPNLLTTFSSTLSYIWG